MAQKKTAPTSEEGIGVLILMALIPLFAMFVETMLVPALTIISAEFSSQSQWISWVIAAVLLVGAVATPVIGKLGDIYGKKKVFIGVMAVYCAGIAGAAFSPDMYTLILFRAVQGVGLGLFPLAYSVVRETYRNEPQRMMLGLGLISGMFAIGSAIGLVAGGYLISIFSWRFCFMLILPVFLILFAGVWFMVREGEVRREGKLDYMGAIILGAAIFLLITGLTLSEGSGTADGGVIGMIALSLILFAVFAYWEKRADQPIADLKLLTLRPLLLANIASLFGGFCMLGLYQVIPFFLAAPSVGYLINDSFMVGLFILPMAVTMLIFSLLGGRIIARQAGPLILIGGLVVVAIGFFMLAALYSDVVAVLLGTAIIGAGLGLSFVSMIDTITKYSSAADFGLSSSTNSLFRTVGGSIGPVVASLVLAANTLPGETYATLEGYLGFWEISGGVAILGAVVALIFLLDRKRDEKSGRLISPAGD